jgi:hypothetical protein
VKAPDLIVALMIRRLESALIFQGNLKLLFRKKTIRLLIAALILVLTASHSHAGLGWTLEQFEQQYGKPVSDQEQIAGRKGYIFTGEDYIIAAFFRNTQVSRILYICRGSSVLNWERARTLLKANAPDAVWDDASKNEADNTYRVNGTKDGLESYYASLTDDGKMLAIWTQEDDELTAGHPASLNSETAPEINHPDLPANAAPSSTPQRSSSVHATRTKIANAKLRSSRREIFHVANSDAKARSTEPSNQHVGGYHPAPTPLLMNAGNGLYNSDYTQPFKNQKKNPGP